VERDEREAEMRTMPLGGNTRTTAWAVRGDVPPLCPLPKAALTVKRGFPGSRGIQPRNRILPLAGSIPALGTWTVK